MDESKRSELRKQMNERLVKIELNERVELECSKLSSSRGFDYIRQFCDSCIEFVSSFHSCLCDMDRSSQLPPSDRETHFKATFFKYLDYLFEILKYELNKLSKDKSSASIQSLPEVIDFILKSTSDFKNYDFDSNDTYFIQAVRPHNINSFEHQLRQALWHTSNGTLSPFLASPISSPLVLQLLLLNRNYSFEKERKEFLLHPLTPIYTLFNILLFNES